MAEETVILHLEVDQAKAATDLLRTEKAILNVKEEQKELTAEYRKGTISQDQYAKENLKLQSTLKKEQEQKRVLNRMLETESNSRNALKLRVGQLAKEYDNLNKETAEGIKQADKLEKELKQLNDELTKGDKKAGLFKNQIGNYPAQFADAAKNINIAGTSVGAITTQLAAFANPATAAVGLVSALGAAYASSTVGAKDLEFAHNQLSAANSILSNSFAELISSTEDGQGLFSQLTNDLLQRINPGLAAASNLIAQSLETFEDLEREEISIRADISDRLEENQEQLTKISDEQTSINEKLNATKVIEANLVNNRAILVDVLGKQLQELELQLAFDQQNEELQTRILQLKREISKEETGTTKKIQANQRLQDDILAKERKRVAETIRKTKPGFQSSSDPVFDDTPISEVPAIPLPTDEQLDQAEEQFRRSEENSAESLRRRRDQHLEYENWLRAQDANYSDYLRNQEEQRIALVSGSIDAIATLFKQGSQEFQILSSAQAIVNTYAAATAALAPPPLGAGPILGPAFAALAIAQGLANVAKINGLQFAEGGFTGAGGKYEPAGIVHKGEYVVPQSVTYSPAAQGHISALEGMRKGYADGGFVTNQSISATQQSIIMANALKNLPPAQLSVKEVTTVQNRIAVRERLSKR